MIRSISMSQILNKSQKIVKLNIQKWKLKDLNGDDKTENQIILCPYQQLIEFPQPGMNQISH